MTQDAGYQIAISFSQIGDELVGAPLVVEIVSPSGRAHRALVTVSSTPVIEPVSAPGNYLVRTILPLGQVVADVATIPEQPDASGIARGTVVLDLVDDIVGKLLEPARAESSGAPGWHAPSTYMTGAARYIAWGSDLLASAASSLRTGIDAVSVLMGSNPTRRSVEVATGHRKGLASVSASWRGTSVGGGGEQSRLEGMTYDWHHFARWKQHGDKTSLPIVVARRGGTETIKEDGLIRPPSKKDWPLLIEVSTPSAGASLIAWLPNSQGRPARIAADPDDAALRSGSSLLAFNGCEDPTTATLFSLIRRQALEDARIALPSLIRSLEKPNARIGPNQRTLAAYVLYRLRDQKAAKMIADLCEDYPEVPDGHVLRGAQLISGGRAEEAGQHFDAAVARGIPVYTEGARLLRDGTSFLSDLYQTENFRSNARLANCLAAAANFKSELTCLRVGQDIALEVLSKHDALA